MRSGLCYSVLFLIIIPSAPPSLGIMQRSISAFTTLVSGSVVPCPAGRRCPDRTLARCRTFTKIVVVKLEQTVWEKEGRRQKSPLGLLFHKRSQMVNFFFRLGTMNEDFRGSYTFHSYSFLIYIDFN